MSANNKIAVRNFNLMLGFSLSQKLKFLGALNKKWWNVKHSTSFIVGAEGGT